MILVKYLHFKHYTHIPDVCKNYSSFGKCSKSCTVAEKRYEVDVVIQTKVILHQVMPVECPKCNNEILSGLFCIPIRTGTIHKMVTKCARKILPIIDVIKEKIMTIMSYL